MGLKLHFTVGFMQTRREKKRLEGKRIMKKWGLEAEVTDDLWIDTAIQLKFVFSERNKMIINASHQQQYLLSTYIEMQIIKD